MYTVWSEFRVIKIVEITLKTYMIFTIFVTRNVKHPVCASIYIYNIPYADTMHAQRLEYLNIIIINVYIENLPRSCARRVSTPIVCGFDVLRNMIHNTCQTDFYNIIIYNYISLGLGFVSIWILFLILLW